MEKYHKNGKKNLSLAWFHLEYSGKKNLDSLRYTDSWKKVELPADKER